MASQLLDGNTSYVDLSTPIVVEPDLVVGIRDIEELMETDEKKSLLFLIGLLLFKC